MQLAAIATLPMDRVDGDEAAVRIGGPDERFEVEVGFVDEAFDGGLQVGGGTGHAPLELTPGDLSEKPLTAFNHEHEVGVK